MTDLEDRERRRSGRGGVTVTGNGRVAGPPDVVRLDLAAETSAVSIQTALSGASAGQEAMRAALLAAGVRQEDLRTTQTSAHIDYGPSGEGPRGYVARLGLSATVRDVASAGAVVTQALEAAGEAARLDGLVFSHSDPSGLLKAAREAAFADATAKAEQYAALAGRQLGTIQRVDETSTGGGGPIPVFRAQAFAADMAVEPGEQEVGASVTVRWAWQG